MQSLNFNESEIKKSSGSIRLFGFNDKTDEIFPTWGFFFEAGVFWFWALLALGVKEGMMGVVPGGNAAEDGGGRSGSWPALPTGSPVLEVTDIERTGLEVEELEAFLLLPPPPANK